MNISLSFFVKPLYPYFTTLGTLSISQLLWSICYRNMQLEAQKINISNDFSKYPMWPTDEVTAKIWYRYHSCLNVILNLYHALSALCKYVHMTYVNRYSCVKYKYTYKYSDLKPQVQVQVLQNCTGVQVQVSSTTSLQTDHDYRLDGCHISFVRYTVSDHHDVQLQTSTTPSLSSPLEHLLLLLLDN